MEGEGQSVERLVVGGALDAAHSHSIDTLLQQAGGCGLREG